MGFRADPLRMPVRGSRPDRIVGLPMESGDTLAIGDITITESSARLVVSNAAMNTVSRTINGVVYAAGKAVEFDLDSPIGSDLEASTEYIQFDYTAPSGFTGPARLYVDLLVSTEVDYANVDAYITDAAYVVSSSTTETIGETAGHLNLYVAPNGSDSATGTRDDAWLTAGKARDYVAGLTLTQPVTIWFRAGTYRTTAAFALGPDNSGTEAYPITYAAYPNEEVRFTVSKLVPGAWTLDSGSVYKITLSGQADFRELYVDGVRCTRARYPNDGTFALMVVYPSSTTVYDHFEIDPADDFEADLVAGETVDIITYIGHIQDRLTFDHMTGNDLYVTNNSLAGFNFNNRPDYGRWFAEGSRSFITEGEFYFNPTTEVLYYWPRSGEVLGTSTVEIPTDTEIVDFQGTAATLDFSGDCTLHVRVRDDYAYPGASGTFSERHIFNTTVDDALGFRLVLRRQEVATVDYQSFPLVSFGDHASPQYISALTGAGCDDGSWHDLSVAFDRTNLTIRIYKDGALLSTTTGITTARFAALTSHVVQLGGYASATSLEGAIDEVIVVDGDVDLTAHNLLVAGTLDSFTKRYHLALTDRSFDCQCDTIAATRHWRLSHTGAEGSGSDSVRHPEFTDGTNDTQALLFDGVLDSISYGLMPGSYVEWINFRNIKFSQCDYVIGEQTSYGDDIISPLTGAINMKFARFISFATCEIADVGGSAVQMDRCNNTSWLSNSIHGVGYHGIAPLGKFGEVADDIYGSHKIWNNDIYDFGLTQRGGCGVYPRLSGRNEISWNRIYNGTYAGMRLFGNLNSLFTSNGFNKVHHNHVYDVMQEMFDGAGIFLSGMQPETVVSDNHVHDCKRTSKHQIRTDQTWPAGGLGIGHIRAIYIDEGGSGIEVTRNLCYRSQAAPMFMHITNRNHIHNNKFIDPIDGGVACLQQKFSGVRAFGEGGSNTFPVRNVIERNIYYTSNTDAGYSLVHSYANLAAIISAYGEQISNNGHNLFNNDLLLIDPDSGATTEHDIAYFQTNANLENGSIVGEPGFINPAIDDYRLLPTSPALALGFKDFVVPGQIFADNLSVTNFGRQTTLDAGNATVSQVADYVGTLTENLNARGYLTDSNQAPAGRYLKTRSSSVPGVATYPEPDDHGIHTKIGSPDVYYWAVNIDGVVKYSVLT